MNAVVNRLNRLARGLRGHDALEDKLVLLGAGGIVIFVSLVVTLFVVQNILGGAQRRLSERALPAEQEIARLQSSIAAAFGRQAQVSSTIDLKQLEPLRDRSTVEQPLRAAARAIESRLTPDELSSLPAPMRARLIGFALHVEQFLAVDTSLLGSVERRHKLQAEFEKDLGSIDEDIRGLTQDSQATAGMLRLQWMLIMRGIANSLDRGGVRMDLLRTAVYGNVRNALNDTSEVANGVLTFGILTGKIGLAVSSDAINSIVANELPQVKARIVRSLASVQHRSGEWPDVTARIATLTRRFDEIAPRVMDDKRPDSLISLRRRVIAEAGAAASIRAEAVVAAAELTADTAAIEEQVAILLAASAREQKVTVGSARLVSAIVTLIGVLFCVLGARRIRNGIEELEGKNQRLTDLKDNLEKLNANLESLVAARTQALVDRDRAMQRALDSMTEGLATVSLDGSIRPERSRAFSTIFGDPGDKPLWEVLFPGDAQRAEMYACGFSQVTDEVFPFEVAVDQLPKQIQREGRTLELELRAVYEADRLDAVLLVASDVTERIGALRAERAAREEQKVVAHILRDRRGFMRSIEEMRGLIRASRSAGDAGELRRALHTIKGNSAVLGFVTLAEKAHGLEDALDRDGELAPTALDDLASGFADCLRRVEEHVNAARDRLDVDPADYRQLVSSLVERADHEEILATVERWQLEPIGNVLQQLGSHARRLAEQLGKKVEVVVESNQIRVGNDALRTFCGSLVHAVRNAVDHGIESPAVRVARGKPEVGTLRLAAAIENRRLIVSIADDGAGVDLERVRARAGELGLPCKSPSQVLEAIFSDGVTTRADVTEVSGRGIGTSAVRSACRQLGGEATIRSEFGRGTELRCVLPDSTLHASAPASPVAA